MKWQTKSWCVHVISLSGSWFSQVTSPENKAPIYFLYNNVLSSLREDCLSPVSPGKIKLTLNNEMEVEAIYRVRAEFFSLLYPCCHFQRFQIEVEMLWIHSIWVLIGRWLLLHIRKTFNVPYIKWIKYIYPESKERIELRSKHSFYEPSSQLLYIL